MSRTRRCALVLSAAIALVAPACGDDPPEQEMQQAQTAIDSARANGADTYAHDEFAAAERALSDAHSSVAEHDYRQALNRALDSRDRAQTAAKEAADQKALARKDAERALAEASQALARATSSLGAAESARVPARTLAVPRRAVADTETAVQEARAAFDRGDYRESLKRVAGASARLTAVSRDVDAAAAGAVRHKR